MGLDIHSFGQEPEQIDQYQSREKVVGILTQSSVGDILHIAPSRKSSIFLKLAPLFAGIGADNVQIHGMIEGIIDEGGIRKVRLTSTLFSLLCDLNGKPRGYLTENDRTFSVDNVDVVHRDSAEEYIPKETDGKFRKRQLVVVRAIDLDHIERDMILRIEGYLDGWLLGTWVDADNRINGFRTARSAESCQPLLDDK